VDGIRKVSFLYFENLNSIADHVGEQWRQVTCSFLSGFSYYTRHLFQLTTLPQNKCKIKKTTHIIIIIIIIYYNMMDMVTSLSCKYAILGFTLGRQACPRAIWLAHKGLFGASVYFPFFNGRGRREVTHMRKICIYLQGEVLRSLDLPPATLPWLMSFFPNKQPPILFILLYIYNCFLF
jgi:hypothetical protein